PSAPPSFPYPTLFRSAAADRPVLPPGGQRLVRDRLQEGRQAQPGRQGRRREAGRQARRQAGRQAGGEGDASGGIRHGGGVIPDSDRKSTRLNSSHVKI